MSKVVYWISYIVSCRTYQITTDHKFTTLTRLNSNTQLHQGAPPMGIREDGNRRIHSTGNIVKLFSGNEFVGIKYYLLSITIFSTLDRYNKQTNIENNDNPFWGSREQRKRFWDQGNLRLKHSREHRGFVDGEQCIK